MGARDAPLTICMTAGRGEFTAANPVDGLEAAYGRGESDEFVKPTAIVPHGECTGHHERR